MTCPVTPALFAVDALVQDLAEGLDTTRRALAWLRAAGLNPDGAALGAAVAALVLGDDERYVEACRTLARRAVAAA